MNPTGSAPLVPQSGRLAFGAITATTPATANLLLTCNTAKRAITILNSCDNPITLTLNGVNWIVLEEKTVLWFDIETWGKQLMSGDVLGAYNNGLAPTVGSIRVTVH